MKNKIALALGCAFMLFTTACSDNNNDVIVLKMAQASSQDGAIGLAMDEFAKDVKEKSGGRIEVHTFHNGQLGTERENIESVQMGNLDLAVVNQSVLVNFKKDIAIFDLPYTITSKEHADKVFLGPIGQRFLDELASVRLKGLAIWESGFRNLTNSKLDVNSVDDVKGLRVRVMENKIHQELWGALGADPVPMSWSDAYTGMQQGAIDGQENPATVIDKNNVVEVNKHMAMTEHCYSTVFILMSPKSYEKLSVQDREIIESCMQRASIAERELSRSMDVEAIDTLKNKGMVVTYPDKQGFIKDSQAVREKYSKSFGKLASEIESLSR